MHIEKHRHLLHLYLFYLFPGDIGQTPGKPSVKDKRPMLRCQAVLMIPNITLSPSLEQIQVTMTKAVQTIMQVMNCVQQWRKRQFGEVKAVFYFPL